MTVMDLALQSGGLSEFAAGNRATLQRTIDGEPQYYAVRLDSILDDGQMQTNYEVYPGDVLSVPEKQLIRGEF
jgi:polysaccharide export outer membrane protein